MDNDSEPDPWRLIPGLGRYGELYPSMVARLRKVTASGDPMVARLRNALGAREERRLKLLAERFGLTAKEARLALFLADGGSIAEYATAAGVTVGTARTHLKAVFAKTGVNRQSALAHLVIRGV